jgi:hypothetical protein
MNGNSNFAEMMMMMVKQIISETDPAKTGATKITSLVGGRKMAVGLFAMLFAVYVGLFQSDNTIFDATFVQNVFYAGLGLIGAGNLFEHTTSTFRTNSITNAMIEKMPELLAQVNKSKAVPPQTVSTGEDETSPAITSYLQQAEANETPTPLT